MSAEDIKCIYKYVEQVYADKNKNIDTSFVSSLHKSIQETSQLLTYNNIKDRRMVTYTKSLPPPNPMKKFLCLDYVFKEENSQELSK